MLMRNIQSISRSSSWNIKNFDKSLKKLSDVMEEREKKKKVLKLFFLGVLVGRGGRSVWLVQGQEREKKIKWRARQGKASPPVVGLVGVWNSGIAG